MNSDQNHNNAYTPHTLTTTLCDPSASSSWGLLSLWSFPLLRTDASPSQAHLGNKRQLTTSKSLIQSHSPVDETVAQDMEGQGDGNQHKGELSPVTGLVS